MELLLWIHFFLGLMNLFVGTTRWTEMEVDLGNNITIPCSLKIEEIVYWYKQQETQSPTFILRFIYDKFTFYNNNSFKDKYYLLPDEGLFIRNITMEDYVVYYCGKKNGSSFTFDAATRLVSVRHPGTTVRPGTTDPSKAKTRGASSDDLSGPKNESSECSTGTSFSLELILSAVIIGILLLLLVVSSCWISSLRRRVFKQGPLPPPPQLQYEPQYETVQLSSTSNTVQFVPNSTIYSEVQFATNLRLKPYATPDNNYTLADHPCT